MKSRMADVPVRAPGVSRIDLRPGDTFPRRHIGPGRDDIREMLSVIGASSLSDLMAEIIPAGIRCRVPLKLPPAESESGTVSSLGYWNGKMAWDRADGKCARSPALSYSNTYRSWRICRLDGHLAYDITCEDELPPTDRPWHVYKKGVAPAPKVVIHHCDPRLPCPKPNVVFVLGGPGAGKGTMLELAFRYGSHGVVCWWVNETMN